MAIEQEFVKLAADACSKSYGLGAGDDDVRCLKEYLINGEILAFMQFDETNRRAYVAFRGSEGLAKNPGNWILTNFQSYKTPFRVLDDALTYADREKAQGSVYRLPLPGTVNQGFYRALSKLWYGTDPVLNDMAVDAKPFVRRICRHAVIVVVAVVVGFIIVLLLRGQFAWLSQYPWLPFAVAIGLAVCLVVVEWERGTWEGLLRVKKPPHGRPLHESIDKLNKYESVIFTGHSLGGAMAAIGFAIYRSWCKSDRSRNDNGFVVTFGAPRIGDQELVKAFEDKHAGRYVRVIHASDPVPETPPCSAASTFRRNLWRRGIWGMVITIVSILRGIYGRFYCQSSSGEWTNVAASTIIVGEPAASFSVRFHKMEEYCRISSQISVQKMPTAVEVT